ncbi:AIC_G0009310.mRNA.1.CDS.1 [Saccharomyces cerevisiae]|nr:AIC_G0009310.mRNA.1.CDS.1 [Saccharomyces cerevisiae]CAI4330303.1 CAS_1a_G0009260.mRNA.1.CDS.1 [Saccharomyces cerevisiae]CAI4331919.1 AFI_G0009250.mRNA.1.CDS.1 [Saccharomyces cerevisiae]CAI6553274.1 AIC_G0009310.mRNA.1.CDS.1 [Saccharomyces cerevisiae]CAI6553288.1 AFI_G0009250.mRNA.1.CDS.1 [Saccharomyces cerevisiae]
MPLKSPTKITSTLQKRRAGHILVLAKIGSHLSTARRHSGEIAAYSRKVIGLFLYLKDRSNASHNADNNHYVHSKRNFRITPIT